MRIRLAGIIPEGQGSEARLIRGLERLELIERVTEKGPRFTSNDRIYRLTLAGEGALGLG